MNSWKKQKMGDIDSVIRLLANSNRGYEISEDELNDFII